MKENTNNNVNFLSIEDPKAKELSASDGFAPDPLSLQGL